MKHHRANLLARTRPLRTGAGITAPEQRRVSSITSCSLIARSSLHNTHTARLLEVSLIGWISLNRLARPVAATKVEQFLSTSIVAAITKYVNFGHGVKIPGANT